MGIGTGMRGKDLQKFLMVARDQRVILLVRHTNSDSLQYVGREGYYPKPALVKAKTADIDPKSTARSVNGRMVEQAYRIAGLVVHPGFHPGAFKASKVQKARDCWGDGMTLLGGARLPAAPDPARSETWSAWGVGRKADCSPQWRWRVDVDPASAHFGCLQLAREGLNWAYIHGDYDLKDVIVPGKETDNRRNEGKVDGVKNYTPLLSDVDFDQIRASLNQLIGADMVQHGAEAQFAWHGDEPITVAFPDWTHLLLTDAMTVQRWYEERNRSVLAKTGLDYLRDRSRMFHFGPQGMFAPGRMPIATWG
jgi:hypothetical protein